MRKEAILLSDNALAPFFFGLAEGIGAHWEIRCFFEHAEAWRWFELSEADEAMVEQMAGQKAAPGTWVARVLAWLAADPQADLAACARALGVSARGLQRHLASEGTSFTQLRKR